MYHSVGAFFEEDLNQSSAQNLTSATSRTGSLGFVHGQKSMDAQSLREKYQRRLLVAGEKLVRAQLSIDEVNLSLSSRGKGCSWLTHSVYYICLDCKMTVYRRYSNYLYKIE